MPDRYDVAVVGAGLAGSAVALRLARSGRRVLLLEAERYPVHKMCGEFLSPETRSHFRSLGIEPRLDDLGAVPIRRVAITSSSGARWEGRLPGSGIGLSRWALDPALFEAAVASGVVGEQGARVRSIEGDEARGFEVAFEQDGRERGAAARVVVGAYGKRSRLDKTLRRTSDERGDGFVAFKAHYDGDDLADWIELHAFDGGYCGLSHVEHGHVNACLIARTSTLRSAGGTFDGLREAMVRANAALARRFERLRPLMPRPVSIARVTFRAKPCVSSGVLMVGDTAGMIAPLCGDGMAMALRASEIAAPLVERHLEGGLAFDALGTAYQRAWRREFAGRLRLGRALQAGLFRPAVSRIGLAALAAVPALGSALIRRTRGVEDAPL